MFFLFGMRRRSRGIGVFEIDCPKCGGKHPHQVIGIKRIFTIFFIPLIPLPETYRATCQNCHKHHSIRLDQLPAQPSSSDVRSEDQLS
jgi:ribosomal protein L44E